MSDLADIIEPNPTRTRWQTGKVTSVNPFMVSLYGDAAMAQWMPALIAGLVVNDLVMVLCDSAGSAVVVGKAQNYVRPVTTL